MKKFQTSLLANTLLLYHIKLMAWKNYSYRLKVNKYPWNTQIWPMANNAMRLIMLTVFQVNMSKALDVVSITNIFDTNSQYGDSHRCPSVLICMSIMNWAVNHSHMQCFKHILHFTVYRTSFSTENMCCKHRKKWTQVPYRRSKQDFEYHNVAYFLSIKRKRWYNSYTQFCTFLRWPYLHSIYVQDMI